MQRIFIFLIAVMTLLPAMAEQTRIDRAETGGVNWVEIVQNGKHGVEMGGKVIIPPNYDLVYYTQNHFIGKTGGKAAIYGKDGERIISEYQGYNSIRPHDMGSYIWYEVKTGDNTGISDSHGIELVSPSKGYSKAVYHGENPSNIWIEVQKEGKTGALDEKGRELIAPSRGYDKVNLRQKDINGRYFSIIKDDKYGICDGNGVEIIAPTYPSQIIYSAEDYIYQKPDGNFEIITIGTGQPASTPSVNSPAPQKSTPKTPVTTTAPSSTPSATPAAKAVPSVPEKASDSKAQYECIVCEGNGICTQCSGSGVIFNKVLNSNTPCSYCNQTGKCKACQGTGKQ